MQTIPDEILEAVLTHRPDFAHLVEELKAANLAHIPIIERKICNAVCDDPRGVEYLTIQQIHALTYCSIGKAYGGESRGRGGARPGAGRPSLPEEKQAVAIAYKIKPEAADALDRLAEIWGTSKSRTLQRAILEALARAQS